jgi:uncharacterized membrane protein
MPHCTKCGAAVADNAGFCPSCGAPQSGAPASPGPGTSSVPASAVRDAGLQENVAGLLCYLLGWITGLIFLLIDKRPFVQFHAKQSIVVFGGLNIIHFVVGRIVLMIKAYQGQRFRIPGAADVAESIFGKS